MTNGDSGGALPPIVGITLGDPAGIGPEVVVKAIADATALPSAVCRPLIVGDYAVAEASARRFANGLSLVR